jgi:NodT family efflux transporter outer membrane factor (OMF) lipoprotein
LLLLGVMLLAGGCTLGPNFKLPAASVADQWIEAGNKWVDSGLPEYRNWWTVFKDQQLSRLVDMAYQHNLLLRTAGIRVLEARARLGIAIGEFYPQKQLAGAAIGYNRIPISIPYDIRSNTYWQATFDAQAAWEIDLWGKIRRAIESADDAFLASVANYDDALVTLIGDVVSAYVRIRTIESQRAIARNNVVRQRKALEIAEAKYRYGTVTKRDVYQAQTVLGATEAAIPQFNMQLAQAKNALSVLLGMPPGRLDDLLAGAEHIPSAPLRVAVGIPADLLRRRPDIRRAALQAAAQCAQIGIAKADLLPVFSLMGNIGTVATDIGPHGLGDIFSSDSLAYSIGPAFQWNFLNYGRITNNVRVQDAKFQELLITYRNTVLKAQQEVEDGIATFMYSHQQADLLKKSVIAAQNALGITLTQYDQGSADFTAVLTAERSLYEAQNDLALATGSIALGLVEVYRAMGGGWEIREGRDLVPAATRREMARRTNWGGLLTPELLQPQAPALPSSQKRSPYVRRPEW